MGVLARVRRFCNNCWSVDKDPAMELSCWDERPSRPSRPSRPCANESAYVAVCNASVSVRGAFPARSLVGSVVASAVTVGVAVVVCGERCTPLISRKCLRGSTSNVDEWMRWQMLLLTCSPGDHGLCVQVGLGFSLLLLSEGTRRYQGERYREIECMHPHPLLPIGVSERVSPST